MFFKRKKEDTVEDPNDIKIDGVDIQLRGKEITSPPSIDDKKSDVNSNTIVDAELSKSDSESNENDEAFADGLLSEKETYILPTANSKIIKWGDSVVYELKCMTWPSFHKIIDKMWITIVIACVSGVVLYGLDIGLELLSSLIYK